MLVLSRRTNEKILFPGINTSVQIVAVKPGVVRLGIDAPPEVVVLREEIRDSAQLSQQAGSFLIQPRAASQIREINHLVRNRLNAANIGLALLRRQIKAGLTEASEVTLERIDQEFQTLRQQVEKVVEKTPPAKPRKMCKALLVEDDRNERELLAGFLRMAGMDVVTAGDGTDALDYLRDQGHADVVLLDMVLPRCDGPTTIREIRRDPSLAKLKIFAMTGHSPDRFGICGETSGIDRWFHKPLNPESLLRDLHEEFADVA